MFWQLKLPVAIHSHRRSMSVHSSSAVPSDYWTYVISPHFNIAFVKTGSSIPLLTKWDRSVCGDTHIGFNAISFLLCHILLPGFRMLNTLLLAAIRTQWRRADYAECMCVFKARVYNGLKWQGHVWLVKSRKNTLVAKSLLLLHGTSIHPCTENQTWSKV